MTKYYNQQVNVLLLDDEGGSRRLMVDAIHTVPGARVIENLPDGAAAMRYLSSHAVDLIITDIRMPHVDGLQFAQWMQAFDPECPVVVITGFSDFSYARTAMQYGVRDYLMKPIRLRTFGELIERFRPEITARRESFAVQQNIAIAAEEAALNRAMTADAPCKIPDETARRMTAPCTVYEAEIPENTMTQPELRNYIAAALPGQYVLTMGSRGRKTLFLLIPGARARDPENLAEYAENTLEIPFGWTKIADNVTPESLAEMNVLRQPSPAAKQIAAACRYIRAHLGEPFSRDDVANAVCLAPSYFSHVFKECAGISFQKFVTRERIKRAKQLLATPMAVQEVAAAVGFADRAYFTDVFVRDVGCTPSEYRQRRAAGLLTEEDDA